MKFGINYFYNLYIKNTRPYATSCIHPGSAVVRIYNVYPVISFRIPSIFLCLCCFSPKMWRESPIYIQRCNYSHIDVCLMDVGGILAVYKPIQVRDCKCWNDCTVKKKNEAKLAQSLTSPVQSVHSVWLQFVQRDFPPAHCRYFLCPLLFFMYDGDQCLCSM